jgi:hypothetical protein
MIVVVVLEIMDNRFEFGGGCKHGLNSYGGS